MSENKRNWFTTNIHELVHFTKQNAAKAYERLENHIIDWFLSENNLGGYESAVEAYMRTYSKSNPNFTRADAKEEITADSIAALFSTKDGAKSFVHYIADTYKQKSKEIFDTFEEWINNIITSINTMLKKDVLSPLQRTVLQMDKKQAMSIRKEFLSALDEAIKNYASSKTEQKNNTADGGVKNSLTLGKFADVDVSTKNELSYYFGNDIRLNNISYTQSKVKNKLKQNNFFNTNNRNISVNADTSVVVEISPDGIDETLSYGNKFQTIPRKVKEAKIATIRSLPEMIKYAEVKEQNQKNYHGNKSKFLVLTHPAIVDGIAYEVEIKVKKTSKNKFYIHNLTLIKETDTPTGEVTEESVSTPIISSSQSLNPNVSQNNPNVNNNVKNSLDVDSEDTNNPTDSTDIRYSKDLEFKKALTGFEWKKYNESMATEVDEGLRISDNSILVECENDSKYQYKYVIYDDFEDKPMITDVYAIGRIDTDVEDDVPSQCHNIAKFINGVEKQGYDNRKYVRQIYRDFLKNTSYVLARYNMQTSHFYVIGRGSVENGTNTFDKSERGRSAGNDTRLSRDVDFSQSELESLKDENRELRRKSRYLEKANTNLKEQFKLTGGRVLKPNILNALADRMKKEYRTSMSKEELASRIQQIYERLLDDKENMTWETFLNECTAIAQDAWDNQKAPELDSYAKEILTDIRSSKISLTEEQKKETAYHNDTYRDYLRNNFGNIKIANDGVPLDVKWMEWSEKYPDLFNPETTDLFQHILHLSQNINNR